MATYSNGQTCLEKRGMDERHIEIARSDYNIEKEVLMLETFYLNF